MTQEKSPSRQSWDDTWIQVADVIAERSRCSRAHIGAVIVDDKKRVRATGYNGQASKLMVAGDCINWCERAQGKTGLGSAYDGCPSIHAEANALLYVDRSAIEGGTIYVTAPPCMNCAKLISNSGIVRVVARIREKDYHRNPQQVLKYLEDCKIMTVMITTED